MQQILPLATLGQDDMVTLLGRDDKVAVPDTYIMSGTGGTIVSIRKFPRG